MKLVGISGSPSVRSKTLLAVRRALEFAAESDAELEVTLINLRDYDIVFCDGREPELYEGDTRTVIDEVTSADAVIVGSPMYRGSYTGRLKNLFDVLPNDAVRGKPVGLIATGGSDHHYLAIDHELRPLMAFFGAHTIPGAVYANNGHYSGGELVDEEVLDRLRDVALACVHFAQRLGPADAVGPLPPAIKREFLAGAVHGPAATGTSTATAGGESG